MLVSVAPAAASASAVSAVQKDASPRFTDIQEHNTVRIGVLAHGPHDETLDYWDSLPRQLNHAFSGLHFELVVGGFRDMNAKVAAAEVDVLITNPSHFIQLRDQYTGVRALATVVEEIQGLLLPYFGGVIVVRADRLDLQTLSDLSDQRIGAVDSQSLGGYRAQLLEFHRQGLSRPKYYKFTFTDMPHEQVVEDVVEGRVGAGFVRTGVLEEMAAAGTLDVASIRVLNAQQVPGFPLALSTALYPQWVVAAMPHLSTSWSNHLTATLLTAGLSEMGSPLGSELRFSLAADYYQVEALARTLRLPPYEEVPAVTLNEFSRSHPLVSLGIITLVLVLLATALQLWRARMRFQETAGALERMIATVPVGLSEAEVGKNHTPRLRFLSPKARELIGLSEEDDDATLEDFMRHMYDGDHKRFMEANKQAIVNQATMDVEVRFTIKNKLRWLRIVSTPHMQPKSNMVWSGFIRDVTEERQTSARLQAIFEQAPVSILLQDTETGEVIDANPTTWKEYGFSSREQFLANQASTWMKSEPYTVENAAELSRQAAGGRTLEFEWPSLRVDGAIIWHRVTLAPIRYSERTAVVALCLNITAQRLSNQRLMESEARFRTLLDDIDGVAVQGYQLDGSVTYWNRAAEDLYGFSRDQALKGNLLDLIIPDEMRHEVEENLTRVARGDKIENGELELRASDGSRVPVYSSHTVLRRPGLPPELFCIDIDLRERKRYEEEAMRASQYDTLTGLPNRTLLATLLARACERARARNEYLVCCYLDLDQFKLVNDQCGSKVGDRLLRTVALRLKRMLRDDGVLSRVGGDEFVLFLEGVEHIAELQKRLQSILDHINQPLRILGHTIRTGASIGVTVYPQDQDDPEALLRHANQAMLLAKQEGRNRFNVYDPEIGEDIKRRRSMLLEIEKGIQEKQFFLYFQPKVDIQKMTTLGLEALVRWQHPVHGLLSPQAFLPFLDDSDLELSFGEYVLVEAIRQLEAWRESGLSLSVSVNISGAHLRRPNFSVRLQDMLQAFPKVEPSQLELEILESAASIDTQQVSLTLNQCRGLGVSIALDDFGTGYSSLSRLGSLPIDTLKIDQSFVRQMLEDMRSLSVVKSVIGLSRAFNMQVVAEGVETPEHALSLIALGCDQGQGYAFSRPMPAAMVSVWLQQWRDSGVVRKLSAERKVSPTELALIVASNAHHAWYNQLQIFMQEDTDADVSALLYDHEYCSLGLWIKDEGQRVFGKDEDFQELVSVHREFHSLARDIANAWQAGNGVQSECLSELECVSKEVDRLIEKLRESQRFE